jgi:hypothetical protein
MSALSVVEYVLGGASFISPGEPNLDLAKMEYERLMGMLRRLETAYEAD